MEFPDQPCDSDHLPDITLVPRPCPIKIRTLLQPWWCGTPVWFYGGSTGLRSGSHGGPVNTSNALLSSSNIREPFSCPWQGAWSCWKRPPPSGSIISMTGWTWDEIDPTRQSSYLLHVVKDTEVSDSLCIPIMAIPNSELVGWMDGCRLVKSFSK